MLTLQDIYHTLEYIRGEPSPPIEIQKAYGDNVNEIYNFFCGLKKDYRNAAHFWLTCSAYIDYEYRVGPASFDRSSGHHCLQAGEMFADIFSTGLPGRADLRTGQVSFEALSLERFSSRLAQASARLNELGEEVDYHLEDELLQAVLEKVDSHEISYTALAETTTQYVAFFWYSTD